MRQSNPARWVAALVAICLLFLAAPPAEAESSAPVTLTALDAHDGTITQDPATGHLYLYGTRYGCGFRWQSSSKWCGFGVWKSTSGVSGPWVFQRLLFSSSARNPWRGATWQTVCGTSGAGCFNPRMVRRGDGVWILAFNAPDDYAKLHANAYYFMGCAGPAGPCGPGVKNGSINKPRLWGCATNGDFSLFTNGAGAAFMVCTMPGDWRGMSLTIEQLDRWWTNGVQGFNRKNVAGLLSVESPSVLRSGSTYHLIFGAPNCGYCAASVGAATADSPLGVYTRAADVQSKASSTGQPRSVFMVDGKPWLWVDQWIPGTKTQTGASVLLVPLSADADSVALN